MTTPIARPARRSTDLLLFVVCLAQFMVILDVAIVNVALPSMQSGLGLGTTELQWVVSAYTLTFAGFLLLGARSADLLGRRRVLTAGVGLFALSSLACALADSPALLLGARALQGIAAAIVSPATLSIITSSFAEGPERNRGLGAWAAMGALGGSSGALFGGALTQAFGWAAIFAINVPLGLLVIALGLRVIPGDGVRDVDAARHFDVTGAVLVTAGLSALTFGIVRTDSLSWGAPGVLGPLAAGLALLAAFAYVEARVAVAPLVPPSIVRLRLLLSANLVIALLHAALFAMWFFLTLFIQRVLGGDALEAGVAFLPMTLSIFAGSTLAPRLARRLGVRTALTGAMLTTAAGFALFAELNADSGYFSGVLPGGVLACFGFGVAFVTGTILATQGVPRRQSGLASGLLNASRLVGGALGLAVLSTIAAAHTRASHGPAAAALTDGFSLAFTVGTGILLAGALAAVVLVREPRAVATPEPEPSAA